MTEKTKEELLKPLPTTYEYDGHGGSDAFVSKDHVVEAMQAYADQEKRKEAVAILQFISNSKSAYGIMFGDQPERFANEEREFTSEEMYDLYLQSLTQHVSNDGPKESK